MIRRAAVLVLVLVTALLLDATLLGALRVGGAAPSAVLLAVVAVGLVGGPEDGAGAGFAAGLAVDLLGGGLVGAAALVHLLVGYAAGLLRPRGDGPTLLGAVALGAAATVAAVLGRAAVALLVTPQAPALLPVLPGALAAGALGGLLAPIVLGPVAAALRRVGRW